MNAYSRPLARLRAGLAAVLILGGLAAAAGAATPAGRPAALDHAVRALTAVPRHVSPRLDVFALTLEDRARAVEDLPERFAVADPVRLTPADAGVWEDLPGGRRLWRLRVGCPAALSLNLGFSRYDLPPGAVLRWYAAADGGPVIEFGPADGRGRSELWTPVLITEEAVVELEVDAAAVDRVVLELGSINRGYRVFGEPEADKQGDCNIDIVCPEGSPWRDETAAVAMYSINGTKLCTGTLVNNVRADGTPYFLTAYHCINGQPAANSLVAYWNYYSPDCGDLAGGSLEQFQMGVTFRATYWYSDFTLLEFDEDPNPSWKLTRAGWDRSDAMPASTVTIHHPSVEEMMISFDDDPPAVSTYLETPDPGNGSHWRIIDWDLGTTEGGSSGASLFDPAHRIIGQLHGGYAACGNDYSDWYGRLAVSWEGGGTPESRLSDWLDPDGTGALRVDTIDPLAVRPPLRGIDWIAPNPFREFTEMAFTLSRAAVAHVRVVDLRGRLVRDLGSFEAVEGENIVPWDGHDDAGHRLASGAYVWVVEVGSQRVSGPCTMIN